MSILDASLTDPSCYFQVDELIRRAMREHSPAGQRPTLPAVNSIRSSQMPDGRPIAPGSHGRRASEHANPRGGLRGRGSGYGMSRGGRGGRGQTR